MNKEFFARKKDIDELQINKANASDVYTKEEVINKITEKVSEIVAEAPADFDTLKEMSDWIYTHEESAAAMNTAIQTNANSIESLMTDVNKKVNSDDVYDKATADSRFLGIDATADKAVADENGSNISETFSNVKNDIAINRTTLGTQCKNLLNETEYLASIKTATNGTLSKSDNSITLTATSNDCYTAPFFVSDNGYRIPVSPNTTYILSWESDNSNYGIIHVFMNGIVSKQQAANNSVAKYLKFTTDIDATFITIRFNVRNSGDSITYSNIMLRYADITDDTYEPYKETVDERLIQNKSNIALNKSTLGTQCKNLLKIVPRTITSGGVTCVIDDDGIVTVNGTASETVFINIRSNISLDETLEYTLTGTYDNSSYGYIYYQLAETTGGDNRYNDFGNGVTFKGTCGSVSLRIPAGAVLNNVKYYPMLRYADITDSTYEPYKESVDERITNNVSDIAINKSTLGYQCKNLLKNNAVTQTINGVTFTVNSDGSVTVNGTNTSSSTGANLEICGFKNYGTGKLTASLNSTDSNLYMSVFDKSWIGIGIICDGEITWNNDNKERLARLVVKPGATINNVTVYPMIRYADTADDTYESYKENIDERLIKNKSDIAVNKSTLGTQCKNLLKNNAVTQTVSGVTFTINDDKSITVNGTATAQISFRINGKVGLGIGNYILTGCPSGGSNNTFYLTAYASSAWLSAPDFGSGCRIENKTVTHVVISIASGYTANNLKFYPMLRDGDITDNIYEPYQPSLQEQINNFGVQQQLLCDYSFAATSSTTIQITGLFSSYSAVICIVKYSYGTINIILPLKYIKSIGTSKDYSPVSELNFQYIDDDNLLIGGADAAISNVEIISLY